MVCPRCGAPVAPGQPQCMNCGLPLVRVSTRRPAVISFIAILHFLAGLVMAAAAILLANAGRQPSMQMASWIAIGVAIVAVIHAALAFGLITLRSWGRMVQIIVCFIGLLAFPLGTIVSVMLLIYLFKPGIKALFSGRPYEQFTPEELASLHQVQSGGGTAIIVVIIIVLVLNVAGIGVLAAIAVPNYLKAVQVANQVRTISDLQTIANGIESYKTEHDGKLPPGATFDDIAPKLSSPATVDRWGHPFRYETDGTHYWLGSAGKDGKWENNSLHEYSRGKVETPDSDIVVEDGEFIRQP